MRVQTLYRFRRADGGVDVSPIKPDGDYIEKSRLIADEGKAVTNDGENLFGVIDVDSIEGWYEVDLPIEEEGNS